MGCKSSKNQDSVSHAPRVVVGPVGPPPGLGLYEQESERWSSESSVPESKLDRRSRWWQHNIEHKECVAAEVSDVGEEDLWGNPRYPTLPVPPIASKSSNRRPSGGARETRRVTLEQESGESVITKALRLSKFFGREKQKKEEADLYLEQVLVSHVPPPPPLSMRLDTDEDDEGFAPSSKRRQSHSDSNSSSIHRSKQAHRHPSKADRTGERRRRPNKEHTERRDKERRRRPSKTGSTEGDSERRRRPSKVESTKGDRERRRRPSKTDSEHEDGERTRRPSKSSNKQEDNDRRRRPSKADSRQGDNERWRSPSKYDINGGDNEWRRRPSKADTGERSHSKYRNWDGDNDDDEPQQHGKFTLPPMPPLPPSAPMPPRKVSTSSVISSRDNHNPNSDPMGKTRGRVATAVAAISGMENKSFGLPKNCGPNNNNNNNNNNINNNNNKNNNKNNTDNYKNYNNNNNNNYYNNNSNYKNNNNNNKNNNNRKSMMNNIMKKYRSPTAAPAKTDSMSIYLHPEWPTMGNNNFINGTHSNTQNSFLFGRWSKKRTRFNHKKLQFNDQTAASNMNTITSFCPDF